MPHGDGGRDWSDASVSEGMPKIAGKLQMLGRSKDFRHLDSGTVIQQAFFLFFFLGYPVYDNSLQKT